MSPARRISLAKLEALEVHPFAELFPFASDEEIEGIAGRMADHGFREDRPVILLDGKILDGRNRRKALALAVEKKGRAISAWVAKYDGPLDPLDFVLSENMDRRHLSESQRAIIAANLANWSRGLGRDSDKGAHVHTRDDASKILNVSKRSISYAKQIVQRSDVLAKAVADGGLKVRTAAELIELGDRELANILVQDRRSIIAAAKQIRAENMAASRAAKTARLAAQAAKSEKVADRLPRGEFPIIYCDPPWKQESFSEKTGQDKAAPYRQMALDEIMALCAGDKTPALKTAILFLWVTNNRLMDGGRVLEAWGFDYSTAYAWDKVNIGTGYRVRDRHEHLLIATRGGFHAPDPGLIEDSVQRVKKGKHSAKPVLFAEIIDRQYPDLPKLELFQRAGSLAPGDIRLHRRDQGRWTFWGDEAGDL